MSNVHQVPANTLNPQNPPVDTPAQNSQSPVNPPSEEQKKEEPKEELKMLPVSTVLATEIAKGFIQIVAGTRETEKTGKIPEAEKRRVIQIPEFDVSSVPSKFAILVKDSLEQAATAQLRALWDADKQLKEVPAALWTVDAILLFVAREAESKRLTKENIQGWLKTAELGKRLEKASEKSRKEFTANLLGMSAPSPQVTLQNCVILAQSLAKSESDCESLIGSQLLSKIKRRIELLTKQMSEVSELSEI